MSLRLNFVIFGATGYTGKIVVNELALAAQNFNFSWGIAGRSIDKLKQILNTVSTANNIKLDNVETISADINNLNSIKDMCNKTTILINCVGPYRYFGEQVIKQCLITKTHHLDLSGEPEFLEKIQLKYNKEALEKNVFIIGGCGFDSVVADIGVLYTRKNSPQELSYIESYLTLNPAGKFAFNYATWESAIEGFSSIKNLKQIRKAIFTPSMPKLEIRAPKRCNLLGYFYDKLLQKYCVAFLGSDKSVVERTQLFNYRVQNQKPFHYMPYMTVNGFYNVILFFAYGFIFTILVKFKLGRYLLLKYYNFFSNGLISKSDYLIENSQKVTFRTEFRGHGLDQTNKMTKLITTEITGPEPAYLVASRIIVNSAIVLLNEIENISVKGGVLTPGSAFINTTLIDKLQSNGVKFKVIQSNKLKSNI